MSVSSLRRAARTRCHVSSAGWAGAASLGQMRQVLLASGKHQTHPLTPHGCIALSLVQLQFETDASCWR